MASNIDREKKELQRTIRDAKKQLKQLGDEKKVDAALENWKQLDELKQTIAKMCRENGTTLKKLMATPDFYVYAQKKGTKKATSKDAEWVKKSLASGTSEAELIKRADELKRKYIASKINKRKRKTTKPSGGNKGGSGSSGSGKNDAAAAQGLA